MWFFRRQNSASRICSACGAKSQYGYSDRAESKLKDIRPLCRTCLITQLEHDYSHYRGRALVIQPVGGPPCYVFRPQSQFEDARINSDVRLFLSQMSASCSKCEQTSTYLWVESQGLTADNWGEVIERGVSDTLLKWENPPPISMCAQCCVRHIDSTLQLRGMTYIEVCSPKDEDGFVLPMGY